MTYLYVGIAIILVVLIAVLIRASRHTYRPTSGRSMGASARQTKLDSREKGGRWGAGTP